MSPMMSAETIDTLAASAVRKRPRLRAAIGLFLLAPLVGEFLLGNLPITWLWALLALAPLYGGGALLIREISRRLGLGWPGIITLGLTYAVLEEAFVTASLFNPNYVGLRLLDYGFLPALGIGSWWTVFVLTLHTVWSTAVPIALVEGLTPGSHRAPWLGWKGIVVTVLVFAFGCLASFSFQQPPFIASVPQYAVSAVVTLLLVTTALWLGRRDRPRRSGTAPSPVAVGLASLLLGSAFMGMTPLVERIPAALNVGGMLGLVAIGVWLLDRWSSRRYWSPRHGVAFAGGLLMTYAWHAFVQTPSVPGVDPRTDTLGNVVFAAGAVVLLLPAWRRASSGERS